MDAMQLLNDTFHDVATDPDTPIDVALDAIGWVIVLDWQRFGEAAEEGEEEG